MLFVVVLLFETVSPLALMGLTKYNLHICVKDCDFSCLKQQIVQTCLGSDGGSMLGFEGSSLLACGTCFSWASSTSCTSSCLHVLVEHNTLTPTKRCFNK